MSNYWSSRESRDTFELKRPDRPTDGASFFFPLFSSSIFFFGVCKLWQKRERERERQAHVVRYIASFSSSSSASSASAVVLRRPTSTEPEGRNLRQKQRKVVVLQQQQPATPPTNKQKKQTNKTSSSAQCCGSTAAAAAALCTLQQPRGGVVRFPTFCTCLLHDGYDGSKISSYLGVIEFNLRSNSECELGNDQ